jgi:3-methylfumaryl-CoA hydratase
MWAGGRLQFIQPLHVGEALSRVSRIVSIDKKRGRSGELVFVTVQHEISNMHGVALLEQQDLVLREAASSETSQAAPARPAPAAEFERSIVPDAVLLFRYSALTFNAHRIHYDLPYATGVEGYPDLIVHGPLTATLLLDLLRRERPRAWVRHFSFRALRPLFANQPFAVCGRCDDALQSVALWARGPDGAVTMEARAEWAPRP